MRNGERWGGAAGGGRRREGGGAGEGAAVVQWYPGHVARAERQLWERLAEVDLVLEVRDARAVAATAHPELAAWAGAKPVVVVLNRADQVSPGCRTRISAYFARRGSAGGGGRGRGGGGGGGGGDWGEPVWCDGRAGRGVREVAAAAGRVGEVINARRAKRGLRPRPVRAAVVGFPNVGKSAVINRIVGRRACDSHDRPGLTRQLRWLKPGAGAVGALELMDSPGVLPSRLEDQRAAQRLAICNDIGEAAYLCSQVAATMVSEFRQLPGGSSEALLRALEERYGLPCRDLTPEEYVYELADAMFQGDVENCGRRLLSDYRRGHLGWYALEIPEPPGGGGRR